MESNIKIHILLGLILFFGFVVRLWRINEPLADWHSWRQVDTAGVTREYLKNGIDLLHPKYMDISSIPSGKENQEGWRMVEFPFINGFVVLTVTTAIKLGLTGNLIFWERIVSIVFSLGSTYLLFLIVKKLINTRTALFSAAVFAFLPFNIYYSRTVLPEPKLVFFSLLSTLGFIEFILNNKRSMLGIGAIGGILAILLKPIWGIIYGPAILYLAIIKFRRDIKKWLWLLAGGVLIILPFLWWRSWISQFPPGIPAYTWLLNAGSIRFRPAWFRWLFMDRLGRLILGYWGLIPFGLGLIIKTIEKEGWFFHLWLLGGLGYLAIFASGNVTHDYYQVVLIPIVAVFVAKGLDFLLSAPSEYFSKFTAYCLLFTVYFFMLAFGWYQVRDFFNINHPEIVEAGQAADKILPINAKVIAPYGGDTAFLFQVNRLGWPVGGNIKEKIKLDASYYVSTNFDDETNELMGKCLVTEKTERYVIVNLLNCEKFKI